jgi:signal transduction histidine kinase
MSKAPGRRRPAWAPTEGPLGIRWLDAGILILVIGLIELNVVTGGGTGAAPLNTQAYLLGAVIALPVLFRNRWPLPMLRISLAVMLIYYSIDRRNISPAPLMGILVYDTAVAGYLTSAIVIPSVIMTAGLIAESLNGGENAVVLASNYMPSIILFVLAVALGEVVRARRALAGETARRLQLAAEERESEAGRLVAEERLRIARELHDTVAHSMATIAVQAGSALHLLPSGARTDAVRTALGGIRETSKSALGEMRSVLGQLRSDGGGAGGTAADEAAARRTGLHRLAALRDAVSAAGITVTVCVEGDPVVLPPEADHAAYRILQESLTNVLRHAGPGADATVLLRYQPGALTLLVTDSGTGGVPGGDGATGDGNGTGGHGINGMRERATAVGGTLTAGCGADSGFEVIATLPIGASAGDGSGEFT